MKMPKGKYVKPCGGCGQDLVFDYYCHYKVRKFCNNKCAGVLRASTTGVVNQFGVSKPWESWEEVILEVRWRRGDPIEDIARQLNRTETMVQSKVTKEGIGRNEEVAKELSKIGGRKNKGNKRPDLKANSFVGKGKDNPFYGKTHTPETRKLISESQKQKSAFIRLNDDPEFQKLRMAGLKVRPNKPEKLLGAILEELYPGVYAYTGDGCSPIGRLSPDFTDSTGKRIVEMFGETYHHPDYSPTPLRPNQTEEGRTKTLAKFGYRLLVVWSKEIFLGGEEGKARLKDKIRRFHENCCD